MSYTYDTRVMANAALGTEHFLTMDGRGRARAERDKKLSLEKAMDSLFKVSGLSDNEFLFEFYQKKFALLGAEPVALERDKLKKLCALMELVMPRFLNMDLPLPERLRHPSLENVYSLGGEISPWRDYFTDLSTANKEYSIYVNKWVDLKSGRKDYQYNAYTREKEDIYFDPEYSLRMDIGREFSKLFLDRLKELLSVDKKASTLQILKRNLDLKDLLCEANRYSGELSEIMHIELKSECEKLEGSDPLSKLCATSMMDALYSHDFDIHAFEAEVVQILWQELVDLQKNDEGREQVQLIKRAISGEIYAGIHETEVN